MATSRKFPVLVAVGLAVATLTLATPANSNAQDVVHDSREDGVRDALPVFIRLQVPAGSRVWFDDSPTSQSGTVRDFVSPALTPGAVYVYHVCVQWEENGANVERNREIKVRAGDRLSLNFGKDIRAPSDNVIPVPGYDPGRRYNAL